MRISEMITRLEAIKAKEGDLNVCTSENHDYWGSLENYLNEYSLQINDYARPKGPKSGESEKALIISTY